MGFKGRRHIYIYIFKSFFKKNFKKKRTVQSQG